VTGVPEPSQTFAKPGRLFVVSGPSGSGKSTLVARALADLPRPIHVSVSATTRPPRPGERHGIDYYFWTPDQFDQAIHNDQFIEWAHVHGHRYGSLRSEVEPYLAQGIDVLLEIDVQGADTVRRLYPQAKCIFVMAPSLADYEKRLRARGTESEESLQRRLQTAQYELQQAARYDCVIVNDDLERAAAALRACLSC